ncbi:LOW QUALITY PROTEIN: pleckstrin homology domain-containing family G member 4B-like [Ciconia maguari]
MFGKRPLLVFCSRRGLLGPGLASARQLGSERRDFLPDGGMRASLGLAPEAGPRAGAKKGCSGAGARLGRPCASPRGVPGTPRSGRSCRSPPPAVWRYRDGAAPSVPPRGVRNRSRPASGHPAEAACCGNRWSPTSHRLASLNKQQNLCDKMDLASYLLKPIQRMSKCALLLKDMIKECTKAQEQELSDLRAAEEMVKFQLHCGNYLLAMDAIQGCDVNLKEQGKLQCQDEFIVCCGRKKYLRHIFLFEDLFSKTRKINGGYDIYMYKQSFKTAESGMTENVGDSGLRFEIWFQRRRESQDKYILQANSAEIKITWTNIIGKILWRQALRNGDIRMQEMVSMGIGNKPLMDIKPSEVAIGNQAIDYIMKGKEPRSRASVAMSVFGHSTPLRRPHSTIRSSSTSSSSSQTSSSILGSLSLHVCSSPLSGFLGLPFYYCSYDISTSIEEDELEQERGSQPSKNGNIELMLRSLEDPDPADVKLLSMG